jgi:basic membrane protein A and related proteins
MIKYSKSGFLLFLFFVCVSFVGCKDESPKKQKKVNVLFTASGLGDLSFNDNLYKGVLQAYSDFDFEVEYGFPDSVAEAESMMHQWVDSVTAKDELIILLGQEYLGMINSFKGEFNGKKVLLIDAKADDYSDLSSVEFSFYGAAFQAGVAAMQFCPNDTAGVIAGMDILPLQNAIDGYKAGVLYGQGKFTQVEFIDTTFDGFRNIEKASLMTEDMFQSTKVIFGIAGYANLGIFETLRKTSGVYAIGVDQDQSWLCLDKIIGSVVKQIDQVAYTTIRDFMNDDFKPGYILSGLGNGYMSFKINPAFESQLSGVITDCYQPALESENTYLQNH